MSTHTELRDTYNDEAVTLALLVLFSHQHHDLELPPHIRRQVERFDAAQLAYIGEDQG